jgi:hypothetical protein
LLHLLDDFETAGFIYLIPEEREKDSRIGDGKQGRNVIPVTFI